MATKKAIGTAMLQKYGRMRVKQEAIQSKEIPFITAMLNNRRNWFINKTDTNIPTQRKNVGRNSRRKYLDKIGMNHSTKVKLPLGSDPNGNTLML